MGNSISSISSISSENNISKSKGGSIEKEGKFLKEIHKTDDDFKIEKGRVYLRDKNTSGFIAFYAPWCHFCVDLAPSWNEYAESMNDSSFKFLAVDCTQDNSSSVVERLDIKGYPTIKYIHPKTQEIVTPTYNDGTSLNRSKEGIHRFLVEKRIL
jgi:thiol-disulfide isomerase/thioredoxin